MNPARGLRFVHKHRLDTMWKPDPHKGERAIDAPHEVMQITRVTGRTVYFGVVGASKADTRMDRDTFEAEYGDALRK